MACPYFKPAEPFSWHAWPDAPRMPLGDPHKGSCAANPSEIPDGRLRTCCNTGYARGACPHFPGGDAPDAVRFGIVDRTRGVAKVQYVLERDHYPYDHGILEIRDSEACTLHAEIVQTQARAFLASYLRRSGEI